MIILLLTLLVIALSITIVGWMLSPKNHVSQPKRISYAVRNQQMERSRSQTRQVGTNRRVRINRSQFETEQRAWSRIFASLNVSSLVGQQRGRVQQTPWLGIVLILLALFLFGTYSLRTLLPNSALIMATSWVDSSNSTTTQSQSKPIVTAPSSAFANMVGADKALVRVGQLEASQYNSAQDYNTWAYSACSAAAMTEVINSYGHNYRIADILKVEAGLGEITPDLGLIEPTGIDKTVAKFGFKATWLVKPSLDQVISVANTGRPIIIGFPPQRWAGGHILILLGGDKDHVYLADSSRLNMRVLTRDTFLKYWIGFSVVVEPSKA